VEYIAFCVCADESWCIWFLYDCSIMFAITEDNGKQIQLAFLNNSSPVTLENARLTDPKWLTYNRSKDRYII
jgi:hypothetical protein